MTETTVPFSTACCETASADALYTPAATSAASTKPIFIAFLMMYLPVL